MKSLGKMLGDAICQAGGDSCVDDVAWLDRVAREYDKARAQLPPDVEAFVQEVEARFLSTPFVHKHPDIPRLVAIVREMGARIATENAFYQQSVAREADLRMMLDESNAKYGQTIETWQRASGCANPETISAVIADFYQRAECKPPLDGIPDGIDRIKKERDALRERLAKLEAAAKSVRDTRAFYWTKEHAICIDALTSLVDDSANGGA